MTSIDQPDPNQQDSAEKLVSPKFEKFPEQQVIANVYMSPPTFIIPDSEPSTAIKDLVTKALSLDIGNGTWTEIDSALQEGYFGPFKEQVRAEITSRFPTPAEGSVVE